MDFPNLNLATLQEQVNTPEKARALLEKIRWPEGAVCPHCDSGNSYKLIPKSGSKSAVRDGVYKCGDCRKQYTVTVGTVFERSKIPLHKWIAAVFLMCSSKKGVSAHQIHRSLGITYKSAWFMCHRIREAMADSPLAEMLGGAVKAVEGDETYVGGKRPGKRGRGAEGKTPVAAMVERGGKSKAFKVKRVTAKNLKQAVRDNVDRKTAIMTDEFPAYRGLGKEFRSHETVNYGRKEYVRGVVHTNTAEGWFSLLKRGDQDAFHHISEKHLDRYLDEFTFRYNRRESTDGERTSAALAEIAGKRLMYKDLIDN